MRVGIIHFANPEYFFLLLVLIPIFLWYYFKQKKSRATLKVSNLDDFTEAPKTLKVRLRVLPYILRVLTVITLILVIAQPQSLRSWENAIKEGIDIVIAMDISSSMLAMDFKPNRLEASKNVATEFISGRKNDRIGLVLFSSESFTQCPVTSDHATLINLMAQVKQGIIQDGTAIGLGLTNAVARLKDSDAKSRVVILLTDGVNNTGNVAPLTAADIAVTYGIRVYTIGVGRNGFAPVPVKDPWGGVDYQNVEVQIDEATLKKISEKTDGKYFRATDNMELKEIYSEIDKLEKSKIEVEKYSKKREEFTAFVVIAGIFLLLELLLRITILRNIP